MVRFLLSLLAAMSAISGTLVGGVFMALPGFCAAHAAGCVAGVIVADKNIVAGLAAATQPISILIMNFLRRNRVDHCHEHLLRRALSAITVGQTFAPAWKADSVARIALSFVFIALALAMALWGAKNFMVNYENFLALLLCVMAPWTAVNLVDFYLVQNGKYDVPSFFAADGGIYGRYNATALFCYGLGIAVQVPFLATDPYTGSIRGGLGGSRYFLAGGACRGGSSLLCVGASRRPRPLGGRFGCRRVSGISFHDLSAASGVPPSLFKRALPDLTEFLNRAQPIIEAVRREGDSALQRFARLYDGVTTANMSLRAEESEFAAAASQVPTEVIGAIKHAVDNIRRFHEAQKPAEMWLKEIQPGVWAGERQVPLDSVACYVPRGKALSRAS